MATLEEMLDVGVHFGHQARKWNPKMAPYIYGERNGIHILDILQTAICLEKARQYARAKAAADGVFLVVGTKSQAASIIKPAAERCQRHDPTQVHYVDHRWLGGMLTNWSTMRICIRRLVELDGRHRSGALDDLPKKEAALARKQLARLEKYLGGVKNMRALPTTVVIVGQPNEMNAVRECQKLGLRTITLLDTDCNPALADIAIPSNDDSIASIELVMREITKGIEEGQLTKQGGDASVEWHAGPSSGRDDSGPPSLQEEGPEYAITNRP